MSQFAVQTEGHHSAEFILNEGIGKISRENLNVPISTTITVGMVLGSTEVVANVTASAIAQAGNTGNGTITPASPPVANTAVDGDYILTCTAAAANAGTFSVQTPDGREIGPLTVAVAFNKEIKLTVNDGSSDWVVGDVIRFRVGVENPGDLNYVPMSLAATDGSQNAAAIAIYAVTNDASTTSKIAGIVRLAEVNGNLLTWPGSITAAQKAEGIEQLRKLGIIVR